MSTIDRYLKSYVRRRRLIMLVRAACMADTLGAAWIIGCVLLVHRVGVSTGFLLSIQLLGGVMMLVILARPVWFLFRRYDPVAVAIEIETHEPAFDQRLITVASPQNDLELMDYLLAEIQPVLAKRAATMLVPIRPLLLPTMTMVCANVIQAVVLHHFIHIVR